MGRGAVAFRCSSKAQPGRGARVTFHKGSSPSTSADTSPLDEVAIAVMHPIGRGIERCLGSFGSWTSRGLVRC